MADATGIRCYQRTAVSTISPEKLVVMLYEGLIRYLQQARIAIEAGRHADKARHLNNAQAVVIELRNSLDHEIGGTIAANLESLYNYIFQECMNALIASDVRPVDNCLRVLAPLLNAWQRIPPGTGERARREREANSALTETAARTPSRTPASVPGGPDPATSRANPLPATTAPPATERRAAESGAAAAGAPALASSLSVAV